MEKLQICTFFAYKKDANNIANSTVMMPDRPSAIPLIAPSISPISKAFDVPRAWEDVPIAIPRTIGFLILNILINVGANTAPMIPVMMTAAIVIGTMPSREALISIAIGVVTDFGIKECVIESSSPKRVHSKMTEDIETIEPTSVPARMGMKFFLSISTCR